MQFCFLFCFGFFWGGGRGYLGIVFKFIFFFFIFGFEIKNARKPNILILSTLTLLQLPNTNLAQRLQKTSVALPRYLHQLQFNVNVHCIRKSN